jgi:hypothetical protein
VASGQAVACGETETPFTSEIPMGVGNLLAKLSTVKQIAERITANLPQTAQATIFRVSGGKVRIKSITGEVTTVIQTQANNTKLVFSSTSPGSDTDLCGVLSTTAKAVGSLFSITGTLATAMKVTTNNMVVPADDLAAPGLVLGPGDIKLDCAASNTGKVKWTCEWEPVDANAMLIPIQA